MTDTNPIRINYTDAQLRVLVEEYIVQQRSTFTLQGVCSYILYWAMDEGTPDGLFQGYHMRPTDTDRVSHVLEKIVNEGRIVTKGNQFTKMMN